MAEYVISLTTAEATADFYGERFPLTTCQKCGLLGAHVPQGWFGGTWRVDRVVHTVWEDDGDGWGEIDVCPTSLADEILLRDLLDDG